MSENPPRPERDPDVNVLGEPLESCGNDPMTGFFRDGDCATGPRDVGSHTVCCAVTDEFLHFSREQGNDLITPVPQYGFPGLIAGDRWCLCAARWLQAHQAGAAPRVYLRRTHQRALEVVALELLKPYAIDLS
ncbi:MAG: DUF2237 family protein [Gammaproteobacteria bacterium]